MPHHRLRPGCRWLRDAPALPPESGGACVLFERPKNGFLRSLGVETYERLAERLKPVELAVGKQLYVHGEPTEWVYFPEATLLSLISSDGAGQSVETSMAGNEGAAGLVEACGSGVSSVDCVVQVDGRAWRTTGAYCRLMASSDAQFSATAWRLAELQVAESRQSGLCQAMHTVEQRAARWLMESFDRSGGRNPLPITQEFLAAMLGVQRTTVSAFASQLQREGLIRYSRGRIEIVNIDDLESRACECRRVMQSERERLHLVAISDR